MIRVVVVVGVTGFVVVRIMVSPVVINVNVFVVLQVKVKKLLLQFTAVDAIVVVTKIATNIAHVV